MFPLQYPETWSSSILLYCAIDSSSTLNILLVLIENSTKLKNQEREKKRKKLLRVNRVPLSEHLSYRNIEILQYFVILSKFKCNTQISHTS